MSSPIGLAPLAHQGLKEKNPPNLSFHQRAPTTQDYKIFDLGDIWIDQSPLSSGLDPDVYMLTSKEANVANWELLVAGTGNVDQFTLDDGTVVLPSGGNIALSGGPGITTQNYGFGDPFVFIANFVWFTDIASPQAVLRQQARVSTTVPITYTIPAVIGVGEEFLFIAGDANAFTVQAGVGQTLRIGSSVSSAGGTIVSSAQGDVLKLVCIAANTTLVAIEAIGTFAFT